MDANNRSWAVLIKCIMSIISAVTSLASFVFESNDIIRKELAVVSERAEKEIAHLKEQLAQNQQGNSTLATLANSIQSLLEANQSMQRELSVEKKLRALAEKENADLKEQLRKLRETNSALHHPTTSMMLQQQQRKVADQSTQTETVASPTTLAAIQQTLPISALLMDKMDCFKRDGSADALRQFQQLFVSGVSERLGDHAHEPVILTREGVLHGSLVECRVRSREVAGCLRKELGGGKLRQIYTYDSATGTSVMLHFKSLVLADEYVCKRDSLNGLVTHSNFPNTVIPFVLNSSTTVLICNLPPRMLMISWVPPFRINLWLAASEDDCEFAFAPFRPAWMRVVGNELLLEMDTETNANIIFRAIHGLEMQGLRLEVTNDH